MNQAIRQHSTWYQLLYGVFALVVVIGFSFPTNSLAGVEREFTEKKARAYCQKSKVRKGVKAKTQNQCCRTVTKQCMKSCSKKKIGGVACSGGCTAAFESCWDKKEKRSKFNAKWMYRYCKKDNRRVKSHNECCREQTTNCSAACDSQYPPSLRGACEKRCQQAQDTCFRVAKVKKKKPFDPNWMDKYCADTKKRKKIGVSTQGECCNTMDDRCIDACDAYPKNERAGCNERCSEAYGLCQKK